MIFLVQFVINKDSYILQTTNFTRTVGKIIFYNSEELSCVCLFQIALEIIQLRIQVTAYFLINVRTTKKQLVGPPCCYIVPIKLDEETSYRFPVQCPLVLCIV